MGSDSSSRFTESFLSAYRRAALATLAALSLLAAAPAAAVESSSTDTAPDFGTETVADQNYVLNTAITSLVLPEATGGNGSLTYALTPALPAGLSFTASTRTLSGTPTAGQAATTYTYKVTDSDSDTADSDADTLTFTIAVTYGCAGSTAVGGSTVTSGGIVDDCEALLASEATLVGAGRGLNWDPGRAMGSWSVVHLKGGRVVGLALLNRSLMGSIPSELGDLSSLEFLNLQNNSLTGSIPAELGKLSKLQRLDLGYNALTGSIPTELGSLSSLQQLALGENQLDGTIPAELGNLSNLTSLWLNNNSLTGSIPSELGDLSELRWLYLYSNSLTGCIPVALQSFARRNDLGFDQINPQKNSVNLPVCPGVPKLTLTPGDAEIEASWTQPIGGVPTGYDLDYKLSSATTWSDASHTGTGITATIDSLTNGSAYDVRVRAKVGSHIGDWSPTASATPIDLPPTFSSASVYGDKLTIVFNKALAPAANLANDAFTVKKTPSGGMETTVSLSATAPSISGDTVVLTLASAVVSTDGGVKVSYDKPSAGTDNRIEDAAGNETESFSDQAVTNLPPHDATVTLTVSPRRLPESANATDITVTATLNGGTRSAVTPVTVTVGSGTAEAGTDFAAVSAFTITIPANAASQTGTFSLDPTQDVVDEPDETVAVDGSTAVAGLAVIDATVTITDDDIRGVTLSVSSLEIDEDNSGTYTVVLDTEPTANVTITPSRSSGDTDVTVSGALTFTTSDWSTAQTVTVSAASDDDLDNDAAVIGHTVAGGDYGTVTADTVSVTVDDDDDDSAPDFGTETVANQNYVPNTAITSLVLPEATGGNGALSYAITPALPAGLSFTASTRTLSGTPTARQAATTYTYKVTDSDTNTADSDADTLTFTIAVTYGCAGSTAVGGSSVTSGGIVDDCEALLASEATLVGAGTGLNWDPGRAMGSWSEVRLEGGRVVNLTLQGRSLMGSIPSELGDLSSLKFLNLTNNSLTGSIPAKLGDLSSLELLDLANNSLTGSIPSELGDLSSLVDLNLAHNSLSGLDPFGAGQSLQPDEPVAEQ